MADGTEPEEALVPRDSDWPETAVVPVAVPVVVPVVMTVVVPVVVPVVLASREVGLDVVGSRQVVAAEAEP